MNISSALTHPLVQSALVPAMKAAIPTSAITQPTSSTVSEASPPHDRQIRDNPLMKAMLERKSSAQDQPALGQPTVQASTDKSGLQKLAGDIAQHTWFIPGLSNMLSGVAGADKGLDGVVKGLVSGLDKTLVDGLGTAIEGAANKDVVSIFKGYGQAVKHNASTPESVKSVLANLV